MKKYLFLLFLFFVFLVLKLQNREIYALSYNDISNSYVVDLNLNFKSGINSNKLIELLNDYEDEYYIYMINYNTNISNITCSIVKECINDIYNIEDNKFIDNYLTNGFVIKNIKLLSYKDKILPFLEENNISYEINKNSS